MFACIANPTNSANNPFDIEKFFESKSLKLSTTAADSDGQN